MKLRTFAVTAVTTAALSGLSPATISAQAPAAPRQDPVVVERNRLNAEQTREQLREVLSDYPAPLAQVLRLDPTLMSNPGYLATYPGLAAYFAQHPEVAHNPAYFLGDGYGYQDPHRRTVDAIEESLAGLAFFLFFMTALGVAMHVGRSILEHRRWMHAMKVQTDTHTKLVDRLSSNEELMAYVQSPIGQRFLSSPSVSVEPDRLSSMSTPASRILTAVQIGVVATCGGAGLWIAKARVIEEVAQPLHVISILAIALGIGFVISAFLSYGLSEQMGLMKRRTNE